MEKDGAEGVNSEVAEDRLQKLQSNRIFQAYDVHYGDVYSQSYRNKFIYEPLFGGFPLAGREILDAMCGGGYTTKYLVGQGARVTGLDLSDEALGVYRERYPGCKAICASILKTGFADNAFDGIVVVGGLHHVQPHVEEAVDEIHRILKPGGMFYFMEPHAHSFLDLLRRQWYRRDAFFAPNEAAVDVEGLKKRNAGRFSFKRERYLGGTGYMLILSSGILRIPRPLKALYSPLLLSLESLIPPFVPRGISFVALMAWEKKV